MKKILFLFLCLNLSVFANAQIKIYGGLNLAGASSTDFEQFDISDWEDYGLLSQNPNSAEGRLTVKLQDYKPKSLNFGLLLGGEYQLKEKLSVVGELQFAFSGVTTTALLAGINYDLVSKEKFSLGISPKIGFVAGSADLGTIDLLPGYTPPVILDQGTFNQGDALSMEFSGLAINLGIRPRFTFSEKISLHTFLGYNLGFTSSDGLLSNDNVVPMTAKGIVLSNRGNTQAGLDPKINTTGLNIQLGLVYSLGGK